MLRALWTPSRNDEEARAYLQTRLTVYAKAMFWSFVVLLAFLRTMYWAYPSKEPQNGNYIFVGAAVGLAAMAFIWRVMLVRQQLSARTLFAIDMVFGVGIGTAFGASAYFSPDLRPAAWTSLIFACFTVFTRALVVPSSGWWTMIVSGCTFVPLTASAIGLVFIREQELPGPAFVGGDMLISAVVVLLATTGSRVIYELNRKVNDSKQLGQYTLGRQLGEGGMGVVYEAHHVLLRRPTAIKLLQPDRVGADNLDRFEREVHVMSQLTHPNTAAVYDYGRSPAGVFYYAMEYLGGGLTLATLVKRFGPLPSGRVANILVQVCGALQEAHEANLIHRDIKPANIILCQRGGMPDIAKVLDFGLVKNTTDTTSSTQVILGTPGYVAPEHLLDPAAVGPSVDLYALGAVGYFLLTGRPVFDGKTSLEVVVKHVKETPRKPSELATLLIPEGLEALIMKCLAKTPGERPASAAVLAETLRALPASTDWTELEARRWWRDYRAIDDTTASTTPTMTLPIDLGHRT